MPEMWAQVPETEGGSCDCSDPVQQALCRDPNLRGLSPLELAHALGVPPMQVQRTILDMASKLTGRHVMQQGLSLDDALSIAGSPARRKPIVQAPEASGLAASGLGDDRPGPVVVGGVSLDPLSIALGVVLGAIGVSLLSGESEEEEEEDE